MSGSVTTLPMGPPTTTASDLAKLSGSCLPEPALATLMALQWVGREMTIHLRTCGSRRNKTGRSVKPILSGMPSIRLGMRSTQSIKHTVPTPPLSHRLVSRAVSGSQPHPRLPMALMLLAPHPVVQLVPVTTLSRSPTRSNKELARQRLHLQKDHHHRGCLQVLKTKPSMP